LQVFYSIRSEHQLMEQLDYNLLFRWFVGLSPDDPIWDATVFTKNRERLHAGEHCVKAARRKRTAMWWRKFWLFWPHAIFQRCAPTV
jgi:transposase